MTEVVITISYRKEHWPIAHANSITNTHRLFVRGTGSVYSTNSYQRRVVVVVFLNIAWWDSDCDLILHRKPIIPSNSITNTYILFVQGQHGTRCICPANENHQRRPSQSRHRGVFERHIVRAGLRLRSIYSTKKHQHGTIIIISLL